MGHFDTPEERFLGLKFDFIGETFYGWVGVEVDQTDYTATVTGYAYEDTGGDILAGEVPEPSPLALLAMGATGVAALRRRRKKSNHTTPAKASA